MPHSYKASSNKIIKCTVWSRVFVFVGDGHDSSDPSTYKEVEISQPSKASAS
jgi:hypothetical protein